MGLYRSPTGAIEEIPDDSASAAMAGGYTPVTGTQAGAPVASAETGGILGTLGAGATSALSGATLGLSDIALSGLLNRGDIARLRADREANPIVSSAGQIGGAVLPTLAGAGSLAALPSGILSRGVAPLIERGGVSTIIGGGIEGAVQNAGAYLADTALGDRDLSAEGVASALGSGFAFGSGGAAVHMGVVHGTMAARRMFSRLVDGTDDAAMRASQAWQARYQATLEAHDAALDIAKAELAKARAARESAGLGRDRASAELAKIQALAPEIDAAHAAATGLDEKIAAIEAQEAPKFVGNFEDLNRLVAAHEANRTELEDVLRSIEAPDLGTAAAPVVPVGEFGEPGARGIKSPEDLARAASSAESAPTEPAAVTRALRGETPAESGIPEYSTIMAHEDRVDDYLQRTVPARDIAERGYYEPPGGGTDAVRISNARKAIAEGQREPIKLNIAEDGKITVTDGRHRLAAAIEADAPVKVKWSTGFPPAPDDIFHGVSNDVPRVTVKEIGTSEKYEAVFSDGHKQQISKNDAYDFRENNLPKGFKSDGRVSEYNFSLYDRIPKTASDIKQDSLYAVKPSQFLSRKIEGNEISKLHLDSIKNAWHEGKKLPPLDMYIDNDGKIFIDEGNHRFHAAAETDREVLVRFHQALDGWKKQDGFRDISEILRSELPKKSINVPSGSIQSGDLEALLRGTQAQIGAGRSISDIGASSPARSNYVAEKSAKAQAFRERNAPMAKAEAEANREIAARRAAQLEAAKDAAVERAAIATNDIERAAATSEIKSIDSEITKLGRMPNAVDDVAKVAKVITAYEKSGAELVDGMGDIAPPLAKEHAAAYRAAEDTADRKMVDRSTRAIDDHVDPQPVGRDRRPSANQPAKPQIAEAKQTLRESDAAFKQARVTESEAKIKAREASDAAKIARSSAPISTPESVGTSKLGAILTTAGVAAELGVPGLPNPHDIPVIGPLLSAYLKYRVLKAAVGRFTGRVAATGDTRAAALAAKTKQKVAAAIDRTLGLAAEAAPKARGTIVATSAALGRRIFDDGGANHPTGASPQEQATVRVREILVAASHPELVQAQVRREMHGVVDPDLIAAAEKHLMAMFGHLASVVPKPPPDNDYAQRPWAPSLAATHELSQRLAVINDSTHALNGPMSPAAADTFRTAFPQLYAMAKDRLIARVGDLSSPMPRDSRLRASMLFQIPIDVSTDPSHVAVVRAPPKPEPKTAQMTKVPDLSSMYNPSNTRVK